MLDCALRHLVLETFGENISLSSLLISVCIKIDWFSNSDKSLDVILKQPILVREHIPLPLNYSNFSFIWKTVEYVDSQDGFTLQLWIIAWNSLYNNFDIIICNGFIYRWIVNLLLPCGLSFHIRTKVPYSFSN